MLTKIINIKPIDICGAVAEISNGYEKNNSDLKKKYIIQNINLINIIMKNIKGYCGSFGTGYPFYVLGNEEEPLPIIEEQIRYNNELSEDARKSNCDIWYCATCLAQNGRNMPDLKQICKSCPEVEDFLKPRKVINRLPDVDIWMICQDDYIEDAKKTLSFLFDQYDMRASDIDPIRTILDVGEITNSLLRGIMPNKMLPLDVHIIEYSKFSELVEQVPFVLQQSVESEVMPYLPIHPISLRKTWQYDDEAYNFIFDFLFSLTPFNWEDDLLQKLTQSRSIIANCFTDKQLYDILQLLASKSVIRRFETKQLKKVYKERTESWRK